MNNKFTFEEFIEELAANITTYELIEIKKLLLGHVDKECIDTIHNGYQLISHLLQKRLLNKHKLAFLKKLLQNVSDQHLSALKDYKLSQSKHITGEKTYR